MFMIILFHITCHCITVQLSNADTPMVSYFTQPVFHKRLFLLDWLNTLGIISNAIFILISGYFMANRKGSEINLGRISKKLLLQLGFAALLLVCVPPLVHVVKPLSYMNMQGISIFNGMSWFVGYYFIVITCGALFFNTFLSKLDYEKYSAFLLILFALIQFSWSRGRIEALAAGLGTVLTGLLLYAIGGFIKGSIINVGVRQTFIRLPYPSFHKKDGHNHTHPIQSKRRNPIERMMNYVQLQLYRKNV